MIDPDRGPEVVLFDMDGTIVDSTPAVERAWASFARDHGLDVDTVLATCHGNLAEATVRRHLPHLSDAEVDAIALHQLALEEADLDGVVALVGAHALIAALEKGGVPWAVVTNSPPGLAAARLAAARFAPRVLVTAGDVAHGKPAPDGFELAAQLCGVEISRCLAVEDSDAGIEAATASGAQVVRVVRVGRGLTLTDLHRQLHQAGVVGCAPSVHE